MGAEADADSSAEWPEQIDNLSGEFSGGQSPVWSYATTSISLIPCSFPVQRIIPLPSIDIQKNDALVN